MGVNMRRKIANRWVGLLVAVLVLPSGCSEDDSVPNSPVTTPVIVSGKVTKIVDETPVDGPVVLSVELDNGGMDTLYLPSSFGYQLTSEQEQAYQLIRMLKTGDRVQGRGERTANGLKLYSLQKL